MTLGLRRPLVPIILVLLVTASAPADIVALKRSDGLTTSTNIDTRFNAATVVTTTVHDSYLWLSGAAYYYNYGAAVSVGGGGPLIAKFDLSGLPDFAGGRVNLAEFRIYHSSGNAGGDGGKIATHDWIEGPCLGTTGNQYPGAAGGVCGAHPIGRHTAGNQNANGGTTAPLYSWGPAGNAVWAETIDGAGKRPLKNYGPGGAGYSVFTMTDIVQGWANGLPNYGFYALTGNGAYRTSESIPAEQPVLFIDYDRNGPPNAVTTLAVTAVDWYKIDLTWTAPMDVPAQAVHHYEVRCSLSPIDETNFDAATLIADPPAPAAPGTSQTFTVTGLQPLTQYYFAIRCFDGIGLTSPLSNVVDATTIVTDAIAPAAINDLAVVATHPNYVVLRWTAVGDDGAQGLAAGYELRYSTSPIDEASFAGATLAATTTPNASGQAETLTLRGLLPATTYYFAIKAKDEVPNYASLSNVPVTQTLPADTQAPVAVSDLRVLGMHIRKAKLAWTAPADLGDSGTKAYELRYSASPIDEANWAAAAPVADLPVPAAPGSTESVVVTGLQPSTAYYFAVRTSDWAEPSNLSAVSNVPSGTTRAPIQSVLLRNPWIASDRVADCRSLDTMAATFDKAFTPDGVITPSPTDTQARAINSYNNFKRREYHWADDPPNRGDVVRNMNIYGWSLCGGQATQNASILERMGIGVRTGSVASGAHTLYEVFWDNDWHLMDTMTTMYVFDRANPPSIASAADIKADKSLMTAAVAEGRACPGFLLCPDDVTWFANGTNSWSIIGTPGSTAVTHSMNMDLRYGETLDRTWNAWASQHPTPKTNADTMPGNDPPYHHDCHNDWKDTVNFKYWEPYSTILSHIHTSKPTYRRWSNGTYSLRPDFTSTGYQAAVHGTPVSIATYGADGLMPELHPAAANTTAEIVFKIAMPFLVTDANVSGDFLRTGTGDVTKIFFSSNGTSWSQVWDNTALGTTRLTNLNLRAQVFNLYTYYIKVQLKGVAAKNNAGVSNLAVDTTFEHNKGAMAYLDKGANNITVTFDNPTDLAASGATFKVVYKWKEYDGSGWTIDKSYEHLVATSPTTFTITAGGSKVPRTESIRMELVEPPFDTDAPAAIGNLAQAGLAQTTAVPLSWTATGDDGAAGTANAYDLRYSTMPITDDATFASATPATGMLSPSPAGQAEAFTLTGLTGGNTYYIAIKAIDEAGNSSALSNVIVVTTPPADDRAPETIEDLAARPSMAADGIDLAWTAPADFGHDGVGPYTCTSYDLRYSTNPIDQDNWASATQVTGETAPQAPGAAESFTVTGLADNTVYYFAIKATDSTGNISLISNEATAKTNRQVVLVPVADVGLYGGGADYSNRGTGGRFDIGTTQSALLKFDLAGQLAADEMIISATLQLADTGMGSGYSIHVVGYPLADAWQEGMGNAGAVGDTGYPWGPASIGDAVWAYRQATAVGLGTGSFASTIVATDGIPWNTPGGRGIGTDVLDRLLCEADWAGSLRPLVLTPDGVTVLRGWSSDSLANHGISLWASSGTGYAALTSREYNGTRPRLILTVGLAGDIDHDGHVDVLDLLNLAGSWASSRGDSTYVADSDLNGDGGVDVLDLLILAGNWGR